MIKISNLNKYYNKGKKNELHVINDTSVTFDDTGLVCILGESGSGKTTLMNTISGLDDFVSGSIEVDDKVVTKFGSKEQEIVRNEKFGYIFQNYYLLADQTVDYNIRIALSLYDISDEEKDARIEYVLKAVDMARYRKRPVSQLSGGQQQRIAIARALAKTPKVIFADEPTGNLDEANTMRTMSILKKLSKDCLVIVVTHERSIADFFADRILFISDGKIEKDVRKESNGTYEYVDDSNLYLQEFDKKEYVDDGIKLETFTNNDEKIELNLKLISENGKIYLYADDMTNIEFLTSASEKQVVDSKRPVLELQDVEEMESYTLERIDQAKKPKMSFSEIFTLTLNNLKNMGKKQVFLFLALIVMAVMIVVTIQGIVSVMNADKTDDVVTDSHYLQVKLSQNNTSFADFSEVVPDLLDEVLNADVDGFMYIVPNVGISYSYEGFWQLNDVSSEIENYSVVPIDALDESDIIYGEMADEPYEIVVDQWILTKFITSDNEFSNVITNIRHFLNKSITVDTNAYSITFTIVGICDTDEPSIYMSKYSALGITKDSVPMNSLAELNVMTDNAYADVTLNEGEVLIAKSYISSYIDSYFSTNYPNYYKVYNGDEPWSGRRSTYKSREEYLAAIESSYGITYDEYCELYESTTEDDFSQIEIYYKTNYGGEYQIVGTFDNLEDEDVTLIISEESYNLVVSDICNDTLSFYIYTDDKDAVTEYLTEGVSESLLAKIKIKITDLYEQQLETYNANRKVNLNANMVITVTIFIISMIILYFMMKTNAIKRMTDISVYRLLGISKGSIIATFALENVIITTFTSVAAAVVTLLVMKFISSIAALGMTFTYPWYVFVPTILFFYLVNVIIGILPVIKILKLPPAQLAAKYDI